MRERRQTSDPSDDERLMLADRIDSVSADYDVASVRNARRDQAARPGIVKRSACRSTIPNLPASRKR